MSRTIPVKDGKEANIVLSDIGDGKVLLEISAEEKEVASIVMRRFGGRFVPVPASQLHDLSENKRRLVTLLIRRINARAGGGDRRPMRFR